MEENKNIEIERKFLLRNDSWKGQAEEGVLLIQGYLNTEKERTVRVRIYGEQGFLTIKGKSEGLTRLEFEYEIPKQDVLALLPLCETPPIEKYRYLIRRGALVWEIDEFFGANAGLTLAEVELESEEQEINLPDWVGAEVSQDARYFNSSLSKQPFGEWKADNKE